MRKVREFHVDCETFERTPLGDFGEGHWSRAIGQRSAASLSQYLGRSKSGAQGYGADIDDEDGDGKESNVTDTVFHRLAFAQAYLLHLTARCRAPLMDSGQEREGVLQH